MGRVICIANQKGGVGKTTTAVNLGSALAGLGMRVLLVDMDPQGNATSGLGVDKHKVKRTVYQALLQEATLREVTVPTKYENLSVAPANKNLAGAEIELVGLIARETRLRKAIEAELPNYEYVLIDCPPSLGLLTINALTAADSVLVPLQCEYYAMEGLSQLMETVKLIEQNLNSSLKLEGILLTMFDARNNICHQVAEDVTQHFGWQVFETVIVRNVRLSEAPSHGVPINIYDPQSKGAVGYEALAKEVLSRQPAQPVLPGVK
jgi:chromosome partitioning protein